MKGKKTQMFLQQPFSPLVRFVAAAGSGARARACAAGAGGGHILCTV